MYLGIAYVTSCLDLYCHLIKGRINSRFVSPRFCTASRREIGRIGKIRFLLSICQISLEVSIESDWTIERLIDLFLTFAVSADWVENDVMSSCACEIKTEYQSARCLILGWHMYSGARLFWKPWRDKISALYFAKEKKNSQMVSSTVWRRPKLKRRIRPYVGWVEKWRLLTVFRWERVGNLQSRRLSFWLKKIHGQ